MRRGQMQSLSIVLIAIVVIGFVWVAYSWAVPIIERNTAVTDYNMAERFILELNEKIIDLANSGSGEYIIDIPRGTLSLRGFGYSGEGNNTFLIEFTANLDMICNNTACTDIEGGVEIPIETENIDETGVYGSDEPRVIILSGEESGSTKILKMSMRYRELRGSERGYVIALCPEDGCSGSVSGTGRVMLTFDKRVEMPDAEPLPLVINYIKVKLL